MGRGAHVRARSGGAAGPFDARTSGLLDAWDRFTVDLCRATGLSPAEVRHMTQGELRAWGDVLADRRPLTAADLEGDDA